MRESEGTVNLVNLLSTFEFPSAAVAFCLSGPVDSSSLGEGNGTKPEAYKTGGNVHANKSIGRRAFTSSIKVERSRS